MDKVVVEKEVLVPEERSSGVAASNFFWAFAMVAIVAIVVGALYYSGALRRLTTPQQNKVNVEVSNPPPAQAPAPPANK